MEGRLTVNKEPYDMSMFELSHNSCYVKEGRARYRYRRKRINKAFTERSCGRKQSIQFGR